MSTTHKSQNLFFRIAVGCSLFVFATMAAILYFAIDKSSSVLEQEVADSLIVLNEEKRSRIDLAFENLKIFNDALSFNPTVVDDALNQDSKKERSTRFFSQVVENTGHLYENMFLDVGGFVVADGLNGQSVGFELLGKGRYSGVDVKRENRTIVDNPQFSPITNRQVILISSPVRRSQTDSNPIAVVTSAIDLRAVSDSILAINQNSLNGQTKVYLVDKNGLVLSSNDKEAILKLDFSKNEGSKPFFAKMQSDDSVLANVSIDDKKYKATVTKTHFGDFWVVSAAPVEVYQQKISSLQSGLLIILLIGSLICIFAITMVVYKVTGPLLKRLSHAMNVAESIADNNLHTEIKIDGNDEGTRLLSALKVMRDDLHNTISSVAVTSRSLNEMAIRLNNHSSESMVGLQSQTMNIDSIAKAVNELASAFDEVQGNTASAVDVCNEGADHTNMGRDSVEKTLASIEFLATELNESSISVSSLVELLNQIGTVVSVIRAIAEQTNLLALNAAIESARAGESGRGFAVVADEVRQLAHRTADSTVEIETLITKVQDQSKVVSETMARCNTNATETVAIARIAGNALHEIQAAMARINNENVMIASATKQQATVVREIDQNLTGVKEVSDETLKSNIETNHSSEELKELANSIASDISRFQF